MRHRASTPPRLRNCREIKEKQYALERQDAEKLIANTNKNVDMATNESFSDHELSIIASVTQPTGGAGVEDTEIDISSEAAKYTDSGNETSEDIVSGADMDIMQTRRQSSVNSVNKDGNQMRWNSGVNGKIVEQMHCRRCALLTIWQVR